MLNTDATLNAEGGEECGEYAHDELEHRLESFFVFCVFHGILIIKLMMRLRDAFEMCSGHKPFCLHCKGTTFVDANHTVAYVAVRILNFNCGSAATVHLNDLLLVLPRVARAIWMSSDSLGRVEPCVRACNGSPTT